MVSIADYGLIGNTKTAALISKEGAIEWCCFPRFDSSAIFAKILDPRGGEFKISPVSGFRSEQKYLEDTNVLETIFYTPGGSVKIIDCFTVSSEEEKKKELTPLHEILRIVEGIDGEVELKFEFLPEPDFGRGSATVKKTKWGLRCDYGHETVQLLYDLKGDNQIFKIKAREQRIFSLCYNDVGPGILPPLGEKAIKRLESSVNYWRNWITQCTYQGLYEKDVRRSLLVLKLLTYSPSGAIIAAPTTSLPEEIGGERNWDYRYCWLRDASFTVRAFLGSGFQDEARAFMSWILHSTTLTRPRLQVVYSVFGHSRLREMQIPSFLGFRGSRPVRIGNGADTQFQLDVYGEVMSAVFIYAPHIKKFDSETLNFIKDIADAVCKLWNKPDEGIWEVRSGQHHNVHSKAMAYIALVKFCELSRKHHWKWKLERYESIAKEIKTQIELHGHSDSLSSYVSEYGSHTLDASLLTMPIMGNDWQSERMWKTITAIQKKLMQNDLVFRYLEEDDGLRGGEGAFGACSFWMVEALVRVGKEEEAKKLMQNLLEKQNALGLWPEEIDPHSNEYLGNYPQAFTHTALVGAALALKEVQ